MDIFNKKKLAALQDELTLTTANLEATTKELDDLNDALKANYEQLTDYFRPKYINKYFMFVGSKIAFQVQNVVYSAGVLHFTALVNDFVNKPYVGLYDISIRMLKTIKVITKDDFLGNAKKNNQNKQQRNKENNFKERRR